MVTFGWTSTFTYFVQLHIHKIHLTKTQSLAIPLQLHFKSQTVSFFCFPLKHLSNFIVSHSACYEAHLLHPSWFGYANKTNNNYKCTISLYILSCVSLFPLSWHRQHNGRCVCKACYFLTESTTHMSRFACRHFTVLLHAYCESVFTRWRVQDLLVFSPTQPILYCIFAIDTAYQVIHT